MCPDCGLEMKYGYCSSCDLSSLCALNDSVEDSCDLEIADIVTSLLREMGIRY